MAKFSERDRERLSLFVEEMTAQRAKRGWSQIELADATMYSKSLVAQVETYERAPTEQLAKALDRAFELPGTFLRLYKKVRVGAFPAAFGEFAEHEAKATSLLIAEHSFIPGQFQTEAYAQAVLEHYPNATPDEVAERLKARLDRQAILTRKDPAPPVVWALLDEQILDRETGGPVVMADQLARLTEVAALPNVTIQVIPRDFGGHTGLQGTFHIAEFSRNTGIMFFEDILGGRISDDPAALEEVTLQWRYLMSVALPAGASLELILEKQERWTTQAARGARALTAVPTAERASKSPTPPARSASATPSRPT